jgi:uncharacterized membrane protein
MEPLIKKRIYSLDFLRGLVMIIMALDHSRDFIHFDAFIHDPLDLKTTGPILFFTRWITHFCAPVFVFLAGISIFLQEARKTKNELSAFLLKRGLWLVFVEVVIITFAWTFDSSFPVFVLGVIWAIGISMIGMAALIRLPMKMVLTIGLLLVLGHNVFDYFPSTHSGLFWDLFRNGNFSFHPLIPGHEMAFIYPILPWLGVMSLGYCVGSFYQQGFDPIRRKNLLSRIGLGALAFFVLLRWTNMYGNPFLWSAQVDSVSTLMSFLDLHKYPPSLLYLCMTIGPALLFLAYFENLNNAWSKIVSVYGRVPFFYYVLHFYMLHLIAILVFMNNGHSLNEETSLIFGIPFRFVVAGEGLTLKYVYLIWIAVVIALYPLCKRFSDLKQRKNYWWLSYL